MGVPCEHTQYHCGESTGPLKVTKFMVVKFFKKIQIFIICPKILLQWVHAVTSVATRSKLSVSMWSPRCMPRACPKVHVSSRAVW